MSFTDPRQPGDPLWPSKYPMSELLKRRAMIGEYDFSALYQGVPVPSGGGLFKEIWFANKFVDVAPVIARRVRGWDTAGTEKGGDYTVGVRIAEPSKTDPTTGRTVGAGIFYIEDMQRGQLGPHGVDLLMRTTAELDGIGCAQREEREGGASGLAVIEARTKTLVGFDHAEVKITGSKITRSKPFRAQAEAGNIFIVRAAWNQDYIKELCSFPDGIHDDIVDASSAAFNSVLLEPVPEPSWATW